ncbi:hypothetical protein ATN84_20095 [Paramesorhizobium deserti]|uniref:Big-1 domain-containing protein n=1 Tax=Paramesorhizobium deserti TaxID=1494590 RepID=A0A135HP59_9HYPH|nr:hypothetical protein [Paramesorhizobium deserti]KXF74995.1 hypothetical protein ATN84_20095 [Paramesorhizobium deserti]
MSFGQGQGSGLIITSPDGASLPLYLPSHPLNAIYTGPDDVTIKEVVWSTDRDDDPDYMFTFEPNITNLGETTQITAYGPNKQITVNVYARSSDADNWAVSSPYQLTFTPVTKPQFGEVIDLVSWDDNPLAEGEWHLLQATFREYNGDPVAHYHPVNWEAVADNASVTVELAEPNGATDADGVMTNALRITGDVETTVTVTVTADSTTSDPLKLLFQPPPLDKPAKEGRMVLGPQGDGTIGDPYPLTVTYTDSAGEPMPDGTVVTWHGYPSDRLAFTSPTSKVTGGQGVATNTVTALDGEDIANAVIATTCFNPRIGANDHSDPDLVISFTQSQPTQGVSGIEIDKASCLSEWDVDITDTTQVIKCQARILNQVTTPQSVKLPTTPPVAGVEMWDATTGKPLSAPDGKTYVMQTDASGVATFLIGSANDTYFGVNVQWNDFTSPAAQLAIASGSGRLPAPIVVSGLQNGVLTIPPGVPTFNVTIPTSSNVNKDDPVALVLNNRVVWEGKVDPDFKIPVAYAALDLTNSNTLIYVTTGQQESQPAGGSAFTTSGGPVMTGPYQTVNRGPQMPKVITKTKNVVGPGDITGQGLKVSIPPYGAKQGDVVTVFGYVSGVYGLPLSDPARNIIAVTYNVDARSPLLSGQSVAVYLPQWAMAGYTNGQQADDKGQLQVDYNILSTNGTTWSNIAPGATTYFDLHTTL